MDVKIIALMLIISYLIGSLSAARIISKLKGLPDPTLNGSGNPGATNVLRLGGKKAAIIVLLLDALKGTLAVYLGIFLAFTDTNLALVGLSAFLGHLYPIYYKFKGGKGVATALGVLLAFSWQLALMCIITWIVVAYISRYSSLAALLTAFCAPIYAFLTLPLDYLPVMIMMTITLFWRHRGNIKRLINKQEEKIK